MTYRLGMVLVDCKIYFMFILLLFAVYTSHQKYFYNKITHFDVQCTIIECSPLYINYNHKHAITVFLQSDAAATIFFAALFCAATI